MWLSVIFFIGALSVIQGRQFSDLQNFFAHRDPCVAKILSCDHYRQSFSLYKEKDIGMFTNIDDLKKACKKQTAYIRCMARAEKFCEETIILPTAEEMIKNRRFPADICRPPSPWQPLYLREASCLNDYSRRAFVFCIDKKIGIGNLNPDTTFELGCKYGKAIIDCSATTVQEKCGYYAGCILKKFLKFHSLSDYKCVGFEVDDVEDNYLSSSPNYDIIEAIFHILEERIFHNEPTEGTDMKNIDFEEIQLDYPENHVSDDPLSEESITLVDFNHLNADELLTKKEDSFSDSFDFDTESEDVTTEPDKVVFPALPKNHYIHKNRTTFALYEDLEMGHMKYIGCGEADVFWVMLSPLRSKYCTLMDLKSEYSEFIFKCTIRIDAPCSQELDNEDRNKNAEVFPHGYVVTVLTPPNNQRSIDMAVLNARYLKVYPFSSLYVPEKKINLWTVQANKDTIKETEPVNRKGPLEKEDEYPNIPYRSGNGSGQKKDIHTLNYPFHLDDDDDDDDDDDEDWDYYPLDEYEDDDDDIYFPEFLTNDVIYIEDDAGDLISLHDHRSPIYSNSLYRPHSLFRPRIGVMPASTDSWESGEDGTNRKKKPVQSSISEERILKFKCETSSCKVNPEQQGYCSAEAPCPPNSETISKFGIKPGMDIDLRKRFFYLCQELNQKMRQKIHSSTKLNAIDAEPSLGSRESYVVTPSAKIELPKTTASRQLEKGYDFVTEHSRYPLKEEDGSNIIDIADDSRYLDPDYSSAVTSAPDSADTKIDYLESFGEYYSDESTQGPYNYVSKYPDTTENLKTTIDTKDLESELFPENKPVYDRFIVEILLKFMDVLIFIVEEAFNDIIQ